MFGLSLNWSVGPGFEFAFALESEMGSGFELREINLNSKCPNLSCRISI